MLLHQLQRVVEELETAQLRIFKAVGFFPEIVVALVRDDFDLALNMYVKFTEQYRTKEIHLQNNIILRSEIPR